MRKIRLGEVADVFRTPVSIPAMPLDDVYILGASNIVNNQVHLFDCRGGEKKEERYRLCKNDILLTNDLENIGLFPGSEDAYYQTDGTLVTIRVRAPMKEVHPALLYAYFGLPQIRKQLIQQCCHQYPLVCIDVKKLEKQEIPVLDDPERAESILDVLTTICRLADLRRKQEKLFLELAASILHQELVEGKPVIKKGISLQDLTTDESDTASYCI